MRGVWSFLVLTLCALALAGVASAARPAKADKHDRALIKQLLTLGSIEGEEAPDEGDELFAAAEACPAWQQASEDGQAVLIISLLVPMIFHVIDSDEPALLSYQQRIGAMRPHAAVFKQWLAMKRAETTEMVQFVQGFDSSRLDLCAYLDAVVAAGDDENLLDAAIEKLFVHPDDIAAVVAFVEAGERADAHRKAINKRFAAFLKASGYSRAQVVALTG